MSKNAQGDPLEKTIGGLEEGLKVFDQLIAENAAMVAASETRLRMAKEELPRLIAKQQEVREERQKLLAGNGLASGEKLSTTSGRLRDINETRELCEDEILGLSASIEALIEVGANAKRDRKAQARQIPMARLRDAAGRYNVRAAQLALVAEELRLLRAELSEPPEGKVVQFPGGFINAIPRAFIPGSEDYEDAGSPGKHYFFDSQAVKEKSPRRVRPLTVAPEQEVES